MKNNKLINNRLCLLFLLWIILFSSCTTLPKATVEMSILLEKQIIALENNHKMIINEYFEARKQYAREVIDNEWYPLFLENFFKMKDVKEVWEEAVSATDTKERMETLKDIVQVVQAEYNNMINSVIQPLEKDRIECLTVVQNEYQKAKLMNRTIAENISSVQEVQEIRNNLLPTELKNAEEIMHQYMQKAETILDNVQDAIKAYEKYEKNKDK